MAEQRIAVLRRWKETTQVRYVVLLWPALVTLIIGFVAGAILGSQSFFEADKTQEQQEDFVRPDEIEQSYAEYVILGDGTAEQLFRTGELFAHSSSSYLSRSEIEGLRDIYPAYAYRMLLRYAINEICARTGMHFAEDGRYFPFYSQFDWYRPQSQQRAYNAYEQTNLDLLAQIERENGFR